MMPGKRGEAPATPASLISDCCNHNALELACTVSVIILTNLILAIALILELSIKYRGYQGWP